MEQKNELLQTNPTNGHFENYTAAPHNLLIKTYMELESRTRPPPLHLTTLLTNSPHHLTDHLTDYHHSDHLTDHHHTDHLTTPSPHHLIDYLPDHHFTDHLTDHHRTDHLTTESRSEAKRSRVSTHLVRIPMVQAFGKLCVGEVKIGSCCVRLQELLQLAAQNALDRTPHPSLLRRC